MPHVASVSTGGAKVVAVGIAVALAGCGDSPIDPTPEGIGGKPSREFEADDIGRAEGASQAVRDYCAEAVSEAQRVGCLSHVDDSDLP